MSQPLRILAISGSLRAGSSNTAALQALSMLAPADVLVKLFTQLTDLPYFNPDLDETERLPTTVRAFRTQVGEADGLLICSPEYAHGVPGVLKNALDWLVGSVEFPYKPVALINISPRSIHAHASLVEILTTMSAALIAHPAFTIALPRNRLDVAGMLEDPSIRAALETAMEAFVQALKEVKDVPFSSG
ncbi:MAG: NADPH-dependent FMN reductase [Caldilineaceae bacterium]